MQSPKHNRTIGPFHAHANAIETIALLTHFTNIHTCTTQLTRTTIHKPSYALIKLSPCPTTQNITTANYTTAPIQTTRLITDANNSALTAALKHIKSLTAINQYESTARTHNHTATAINTLWHDQHLHSLIAIKELITAHPNDIDG
ncbi:MAG: hypothetical protein O7C59_11610 [Rickettsia endosymbiont of Ixodes persulcatus]|nr:hypothetical protein [Rickettsia endosymbiont of Ixodes persulcatus]